MRKNSPDKYGRGSAAANGAGFVDLAPGDTFDGLEQQLRAKINEVYENHTLGISASIGSNRNANELAKHRAAGESEEVHKFAAKNVGVLFECGKIGIRHFDKKAILGQRWIVRFIRVFAPFVFDGVNHLATVTLKENESGGNFYSVEALDITKDAWPERTPRGAIPEGLNAAPFLDLASLLANSIAYYVGDCNRTKPEFVNRPESFSIPLAAQLLTNLCDPLCHCASVLKTSPDPSPVYNWLAEARNLGYMLTNLFPDDRKIADWLSRDAVSAVGGAGGARLLAVQEDGFNRLFYAAESLGAAAKACRSYVEMHVGDCVLDVVGPQPVQLEAAAKFAAEGFAVRKTLTRMQRRVSVGEKVGGESRWTADVCPCENGALGDRALPAGECGALGDRALPDGIDGRDRSPSGPDSRSAVERDASVIHQALHRYFDARAEQLPCLDEVRELCANGASFVVETNSEIAAFLLGEIQGKKGTVRYWFTMPAGRGKGVGGAVMRAFFNLCQEKGSTFQELWVLDDNENAIKRYEHYGFKFDRLKDTVWEKMS